MSDTNNPNQAGANRSPNPSPQSLVIPPNDKSVSKAPEDTQFEDEIAESREPIASTWTIEKLQIIVNVVLAVVGIFAMFIYFGQLRVMKSQLREIIKQFPEIRAQRVATQNQLTQQQDHFRVTERAWISVTGTGFGYSEDRGVSRAQGTVVLINTGPSPAFHLDMWSCFQVRADEPIVGDSLPHRGRGCEETSVGILGTNVPLTLSRIDPDKIVAANSLPKNFSETGDRLYVWGRINYFTFVKDGGHFTSFCLMSNATQLGPCRKGNDAN